MKPDNAEIRYLYDMKNVLCNQEWAKNATNYELYYMYRGVKKKNGLRYDITRIPPIKLGKEFVKTKGHEHSENFSEIYEVLEGEALYLIQKFRKNKIEDVYAVRAEKNNAVIVPPGYGHITINPSKKTLVEGNWISEKCKNIYDLFEKKRGGCYFYAESGWIKNKNYSSVPELKFKKPLKTAPEDLNFLKNG